MGVDGRGREDFLWDVELEGRRGKVPVGSRKDEGVGQSSVLDL